MSKFFSYGKVSPDSSQEVPGIQLLKAGFSESTGDELTENDLLDIGILKKHHGKLHPTKEGILLAGLNECARIECYRFKGLDKEEIIDHKIIKGPLHRQVEEVMKFAHLYIAKSGKVIWIRRIDRYEVPLEIIEEAIVNAVVHRDYTIAEAPIEFSIYDDRIEITSPGALPGVIDAERILPGISYTRNKVISRFFREINLMREWGAGLVKILRLSRENGLESPEFQENESFFKIIIRKRAHGDL